jgi:predicted dehydrogenase
MGSGMTDQMQGLRIGIAGAGAIVRQRHLPNLIAIPGVSVQAVANQSVETATAVANTFQIPVVEREWESLVNRIDIDAVWIGTTPHLHAPITIAALEAGKHVFCQARMARNLTEARAMLDCAQAHPGQVTMLCPPPNAMKHGLYLKELLRQRCIGDLFHFQLRSLTSVWEPEAAPHWRQRQEKSGKNILSVGIYAEVLGRLLGDPLALCAQGRVNIPELQGYTVHVPDSVQVIGLWPNNLKGALQWSGVAQFGGPDILELYGSEGTLQYNFSNDRIFLGRHGQEQLSDVPVPSEFVRGWSVEEDFVRAVREGLNPEPSFETGVRYMQFVEAVTESMNRECWISMDSL